MDKVTAFSWQYSQKISQSHCETKKDQNMIDFRFYNDR